MRSRRGRGTATAARRAGHGQPGLPGRPAARPVSPLSVAGEGCGCRARAACARVRRVGACDRCATRRHRPTARPLGTNARALQGGTACAAYRTCDRTGVRSCRSTARVVHGPQRTLSGTHLARKALVRYAPGPEPMWSLQPREAARRGPNRARLGGRAGRPCAAILFPGRWVYSGSPPPSPVSRGLLAATPYETAFLPNPRFLRALVLEGEPLAPRLDRR